jgi:hypothetical protein
MDDGLHEWNGCRGYVAGGKKGQGGQLRERHFPRMNKGGLGLYNGDTGHRSCRHQAFRNVFYVSCMIGKPVQPSRALQGLFLGYELFCCLWYLAPLALMLPYLMKQSLTAVRVEVEGGQKTVYQYWKGCVNVADEGARHGLNAVTRISNSVRFR